jgi:protein-S-isoprenylcysteine O-methyltransferase Ste14
MVPGLSAFAYAYKHDLKLIERRMEVKEKVPAQKLIMKFIYLIYLAAILLPGLDYRFGWSHVPLWLTVVSQAVVFLGFATTIWVLLVNSFASRTIQVEPGQQVISTGPYSIVRHPMYLGASVMLLFTSIGWN